MEVAPWIVVFVVMLLGYPIARRWPAETRFSENLNFWRWVLYSIVNVTAALIVYTLMRAIGLF